MAVILQTIPEKDIEEDATIATLGGDKDCEATVVVADKEDSAAPGCRLLRRWAKLIPVVLLLLVVAIVYHTYHVKHGSYLSREHDEEIVATHPPGYVISNNSTFPVTATLPDTVIWEGPVVVFLDIDGVLAPYSLDPNPYPEDLTYDDDAYETLVEFKCWRNFTDATLYALSSVLEVIPEQQRRVVLSSSWRRTDLCQGVALGLLHEYGVRNGGPLAQIEKFDDITPDDACHQCRQQEIAEWILAHEGEPLAWIALDDLELVDTFQREWNEPYQEMFKGHAVHIEGDDGMTRADALKAIGYLKDQGVGNQ